MPVEKKHILFDTETFKDGLFIFYWYVVEDDNTYHMINPSIEDIRAVFSEYFVDPKVYRGNPGSVMELSRYLYNKNFRDRSALRREVTGAFEQYKARIMEVTE